ncbi:Nephrocystin-3-like protein [Cladobotryum mycophilum]|uniref:Nephrocystin-3-like protein n=1 Tax=Cladobotryum mycophilum TaxID=491253 RepID=A0ABR0SG30_9HYPO
MAVAYEPGLHTVYGDADSSGAEAEIDVVAIHGLNFKGNPNHARATWGSGKYLWLRDFLPTGLKRPCRVMLYSYNSSPAMGAAAMRLDDHARVLLRHLMPKREAAPRRPLVFICHSLGGIVVKTALVEATLNPAYKSIVKSTRLLVFFATPHRGGNYSGIGDVAAKMVRAGLRTPSNDLLDALKASSHDAIRRFEQASHLIERCLVVSFYETTDYGRLGIIVDKESAILNLPEDREKQVAMDANHSSICKFRTPESCEPVLDIISTELERSLELAQRLKPELKNTHWLVSRSANPFFTGRDGIVGQIIKALTGPATLSISQRRFVLTGMGGQGKSEICLNVVSQVRNMFWGVFWVDVGTKATATAGFLRIGRMLGSQAREIDDVLLLLSNCKPQNKWLLVLDNADDPDTDYQDYIPSGDRGAVLMTSRLPECRVHGTVGSEELGSLGEEDCVKLLLNVIGTPEESKPECKPAAEVIAKELGYHALALLHAGAYIASGHCSIEAYPAEFRRQKDRLLSFNLSQSQSRYRNVYATFEASALVLQTSEAESAKDALVLMDILSTLHYENISLDVFDYAWHGSKWALNNDPSVEAIHQLSQWHVSQLPSFLEVSPSSWNKDRLYAAASQLSSLALVNLSDLRGGKAVSFHPLTHGWIATRQNETQRDSYLQSSACLFALSRYSNHSNQQDLDHLGPCVVSILREIQFIDRAMASRHMIQALLQICHILEIARYDHELASLIDRLFQALGVDPDHPSEDTLELFYLASGNQFSLGNTEQCIKTIQAVLALQQSSMDMCHPRLLTTQNELGRAYLAIGQRQDSIAILEEVLDKQDKHLKLQRDHPLRLGVMRQLGTAYSANSQAKKSIPLLEEVVSIQRSTLDKSHAVQIASQYDLAMAYLTNCQSKDAIKVLEEASAAQAGHVDDHHPNRVAIQNGLGEAYLMGGHIEKAIQLLEKGAKIYSAKDEWNPSRLSVRHYLGKAYRKNGQAKDAVAIFENIIEVSHFHAAHPGLMAAQFELAEAYIANGQTKDAIQLFEKIQAVQESSADYLAELPMLQVELGAAYLADGQTAKAIQLTEVSIEAQKENLGEGHPNMLAMKGVAILESVVEMRESTIQENHLSQLTFEHELGRAYLEDGRPKDAIAIFEKVVETKQTHLQESHPELLSSMHELGRAYMKNGQIQQGIRVCEQVVGIQESSLPKGHPNQLSSLSLLAAGYRNSNQTTKAIAILESVMEMEQGQFDETHPERLGTQHQLCSAYIKAGQLDKAIATINGVVRVHEITLQEDHPSRLAAQYQLGSAYLANGQTTDAIAAFQKIIRTQENFGVAEDCQDKLSAKHQLATAYMKNSQAPDAVVLFEEVLRVKMHLDEGDHNRLASQYELASCYLSLGRTEEALALFEEVVRVEASTLEKEDPSRLNSLEQLALTYLKKRKTKRAIKILEEIVPIRKESLPAGHPSRLASVHVLGLAYLEDKRDNKGIAILEEVIVEEKPALGKPHPLYFKTYYELACAYLDMGKTARAIELLEELARLKRMHQDESYPSLYELQHTLEKANKANSFMAHTLIIFGLGACVGR